ncbi:MAG: hypothetical protein ACT4P6_19635 [Gemmatimonadaceae bacterium]
MDDSRSLSDALAQHYVNHGLPLDGGEQDRTFRVRLGRLTVRLPNPPARRRAVFFHDTNHILTGYNTTFSDGEMVIAGFEVGSGCGRYWMAWFINLAMFAFGLVACPRTMFRAFVRGRRASSIYRRTEDRARLGSMSVAALKSMIQLDQQAPVPALRDRLIFAAWAAVTILMLIVPAAILFVAGRLLWQS